MPCFFLISATLRNKNSPWESGQAFVKVMHIMYSSIQHYLLFSFHLVFLKGSCWVNIQWRVRKKQTDQTCSQNTGRILESNSTVTENHYLLHENIKCKKCHTSFNTEIILPVYKRHIVIFLFFSYHSPIPTPKYFLHRYTYTGLLLPIKILQSRKADWNQQKKIASITLLASLLQLKRVHGLGYQFFFFFHRRMYYNK